jgi:uncharacterized LabA/DUF88 family protein
VTIIHTILLIDAENFKSKIKEVFKSVGRENPKWHLYDFKKLLDTTLAGMLCDKVIFYGARIKAHSKTLKKSEELVQAQRLFKTHVEKSGFVFKFGGTVRGHEIGTNKRKTLVFTEKGVDVQIAVDMVSLVCDK